VAVIGGTERWLREINPGADLRTNPGAPPPRTPWTLQCRLSLLLVWVLLSQGCRCRSEAPRHEVQAHHPAQQAPHAGHPSGTSASPRTTSLAEVLGWIAEPVRWAVAVRAPSLWLHHAAVLLELLENTPGAGDRARGVARVLSHWLGAWPPSASRLESVGIAPWGGCVLARLASRGPDHAYALVILSHHPSRLLARIRDIFVSGTPRPTPSAFKGTPPPGLPALPDKAHGHLDAMTLVLPLLGRIFCRARPGAVVCSNRRDLLEPAHMGPGAARARWRERLRSLPEADGLLYWRPAVSGTEVHVSSRGSEGILAVQLLRAAVRVHLRVRPGESQSTLATIARWLLSKLAPSLPGGVVAATPPWVGAHTSAPWLALQTRLHEVSAKGLCRSEREPETKGTGSPSPIAQQPRATWVWAWVTRHGLKIQVGIPGQLVPHATATRTAEHAASLPPMWRCPTIPETTCLLASEPVACRAPSSEGRHPRPPQPAAHQTRSPLLKAVSSRAQRHHARPANAHAAGWPPGWQGASAWLHLAPMSVDRWLTQPDLLRLTAAVLALPAASRDTLMALSTLLAATGRLDVAATLPKPGTLELRAQLGPRRTPSPPSARRLGLPTPLARWIGRILVDATLRIRAPEVRCARLRTRLVACINAFGLATEPTRWLGASLLPSPGARRRLTKRARDSIQAIAQRCHRLRGRVDNAAALARCVKQRGCDRFVRCVLRAFSWKARTSG